jgi:orotate phosphoribosyltransferase
MSGIDLNGLGALLRRIAETPDDPVCQHQVYVELTDHLLDFQNGLSFSIGLLLKLLLEDVLKNTLENTEVSPVQAQQVVQFLVSSFEALIAGNEEKWKDELAKFGNEYQALARHREQDTVITVGGIKFLIARYYEKLLVARNIDFFPSLDATLSDPETAGPVCHWYRDTIHKLTTADDEENRIEGLCVIEKAYSTVGALTLVGYLATHCKLPITICRVPYWDRRHRISGKLPFPGIRLCAVYDVSITGTGILETSEFLKKQYGAQVKHTAVLFDMEDEARENLKAGGIQLHAFRALSEIQQELGADKLLLRTLYTLEKAADQYETNEYFDAIENIIKANGITKNH